MKKFIILLAFLPFFTACDDLFTPAKENIQGLEGNEEWPKYVDGILANAYILLGFSDGPVSDMATDDCVTNDNSSSWLRMATGSWTSNDDPTSQWQSCRHTIMYINNFLSVVDNTVWSADEVINEGFKMRLKGEAYGLRALNMFNLLRAHGGWADDGQLYGVPIITTPEGAGSDFNVPRDTFKDCMDSLIADCNRAIEYLPQDYVNLGQGGTIPAKYTAIGFSNIDDYNRVFGQPFGGRLSGRVAECIRAMAVLMAASPAFSAGSGYTWEQAAEYAAVVIDHMPKDADGVDALGVDQDGYTWYCNTAEINALQAGINPPEVIWRGSSNNNESSLATNNYPPTLYGNGRANPTQNLVDAFPMANGYPITDSRSDYDPNDPYTGRDARLSAYILYNGGTAGPSNSVIITGNYGTTTNDQLNRENGRSTRTGYYMKKHLRQDVNLDPNSTTGQKHYNAYIRATEMFLDYAEAANEAWGPKGKGTHGYSAYDIIKSLRSRAGIGTYVNGQLTDPYLDEMAGSPGTMRELIRNERRLELCFENKRFYDLRRWQVPLEQLNETARGMQITQNNSTAALIYTPITVENRNFQDYMYWGPVPYSECLKFSNLQQNRGW